MINSTIHEHTRRWSEILAIQKIDYLALADLKLDKNDECNINSWNKLYKSIDNNDHAPFEMDVYHYDPSCRFQYYDCLGYEGAWSELRNKDIHLEKDELYVEMILDFTHCVFDNFTAGSLSFMYSTLFPKICVKMHGFSDEFKNKAKIDILVKRDFISESGENVLFQGFPDESSDVIYKFDEKLIFKAISYSLIFRKIYKLFRDQNDDMYHNYMYPKGFFGKIMSIAATDKAAKKYATKNNAYSLSLISCEYAEVSSMISLANSIEPYR